MKIRAGVPRNRMVFVLVLMGALAGQGIAYSPFYPPDLNLSHVRISNLSGIDINYSHPAYSALGTNFPAYASVTKDTNVTIDFNVWDANLSNDLLLSQVVVDANYYGVPVCGNGIVDLGEQCEGVNGCSSCVATFGSRSTLSSAINEPSGIAWHSGKQKFYMPDDQGVLWSMNRDGSGAAQVGTGYGDIEGVTIPDSTSDYVYVSRERFTDRGVLEINVTNGSVRRFFNTEAQMGDGVDNSGPEAIAFIPSAGDPEGGVFFLGQEGEAIIYVYRFPILSSTTDQNVTFLGTLGPWPSASGFKDLHYDVNNDIVYALFDVGATDPLLALTRTGVELYRWTSPANSVYEGIALLDGNIFWAQDNGGGAGDIIETAAFAGIQKPQNGSVIFSDRNLSSGICTLYAPSSGSKYACHLDWDINGVPDGNYVLALTAYDSKTNGNADANHYANVSFMIENTLPVQSGPLPAGNANTTDTTPDFNIAVSDANSGIASCTATPFVDGVSQGTSAGALSNGRCLYTSGALSVGQTILVQFRSRDNAGNYSTDANTGTYTVVAGSVNLPPDINITRVDLNVDTSPWGFFSYARDANLTIDFNVQDPDSNNLRVDLNYSASSAINTGTSIITGVDLNRLAPSGPWKCADTNFQNSTQCSIDWNISGVSDGNYFIHITVTDANSTDQNTSDQSVGIDNTAPWTGWDANSIPQRGDVNVHLSCSDAGAGCLRTQYRKDTDSGSAISFGAWTTFDQNVLFSGDGNWALDFNSIDRAANRGDTNTQFVIIDSNAPWAFNAGPSGTQTSASVSLSLSTNENATCRYSTSNSSFDSLGSSANMGTTGGTSHSQSLSLSNGIYTYYFKCRDLADNNSNDTNTAFLVAVASSGDGGGSSGGGGGGGGSDPPADLWTTVTASNVNAGTDVALAVPNANSHYVYRVRFTSARAIPSVTFRIQGLSQKPASIGAEPAGIGQTAFRFAQITTTLTDEQVDGEIEIFFRVPRAWLTANEHTADKVYLLHWNGSAWERLSTRVESVDSSATGNANLRAQTKAFSVFAIVAGVDPNAEVIPSQDRPDAPGQTQPAGETTAPDGPDAHDTAEPPAESTINPMHINQQAISIEFSATVAVIGLAVLAVLGAGAYFVIHQKQRAQRVELETNARPPPADPNTNTVASGPGTSETRIPEFLRKKE